MREESISTLLRTASFEDVALTNVRSTAPFLGDESIRFAVIGFAVIYWRQSGYALVCACGASLVIDKRYLLNDQ